MRVLIPRGSGEAGKRVSLDETEVHHLRVRRARDGESIQILDGGGLQGTGRLVHSGRDWMVEILSAERRPKPPQLTLAVGAGDRERFSWLVEKSVELGVTDLIPIESAHTTGVATRIKGNHLDRLRRLSLDVLKQCGCPWGPTIHPPVSLTQFLQQPPTGLGWLAEQSGAVLPVALDSRPLTILVGPEGGFTEAERAAIIGAGYHAVTLGTYTLRFETAALVAAAAASQARLRGAHA